LLRRWLSILCAAVLVAGCGSSSGSKESSSDGKATATGTPTVHSSDFQRLPQAPEPSGNPPSSQGGSHDAFLRAVFDDVEALWHREFQGAGVTYRPARLTIFSPA
jgi:predicted metalloprotease